MKPSDPVLFPLKLVTPDGEVEYFDNEGHLETNLEDYDSEDADCGILTDAQNRRVRLKISTTWIERFELYPE